MAKMLDELLDLSRIAHNRIELERVPLDVRRIAELACDNAQAAFEGKGHDLRLSLPAEPVTVVGDEVRLTQVVANLLVNAAKFTPAPGRIEVRVERDGNDAAIEVADDGIGIAPRRLDAVFEMFSQGETKAHGGTPGLGIGLAVVRSLVGLHGGTVRAYSAGAGQGTRIRVTLPLLAQTAPAAATAAPAADAGNRGLRILLADDNADAANLLALLLEAEGHAVHAAFDGISAMALADAHRPEVMVLDIGMPGANGYEVARWVREQPWGAAVRLVAVTGWGQEHDGGRALDAGFDVRLVKPVDMAQLLAAVSGASPG
jgi:two-component system CheB/CheR fusion protein